MRHSSDRRAAAVFPCALGVDVDVKFGAMHLHVGLVGDSLADASTKPADRRSNHLMDTLFQDIRYAIRRVCARRASRRGRPRAGARHRREHRDLHHRQRGADRAAAVSRNRIASSRCGKTNARRPGRSNVVGPANFIRWQERATAFDSMAGLRRDAHQPDRRRRSRGARRQDVTRRSSRCSACRRCSAARSPSREAPTRESSAVDPEP